MTKTDVYYINDLCNKWDRSILQCIFRMQKIQANNGWVLKTNTISNNCYYEKYWWYWTMQHFLATVRWSACSLSYFTIIPLFHVHNSSLRGERREKHKLFWVGNNLTATTSNVWKTRGKNPASRSFSLESLAQPSKIYVSFYTQWIYSPKKFTMTRRIFYVYYHASVRVLAKDNYPIYSYYFLLWRL